MNFLGQRLNRNLPSLLLSAALTVSLAACANLPRAGKPASHKSGDLDRALQAVRARHAPDRHLAIFNVGFQRSGSSVTLTGEVDNVTAKADALAAARAAGFNVTDRITVLPDTEFGDASWGIVCLSVANAREKPENTAELGTQVLMGNPVRVWKRSRIWYLIQTADRYVAWMEKGSFQRCTQADVEAWNNSPLLIVTTFEDCVREKPEAGAQPVTDVVMGGLLKKTGEQGEWFKIELPDHRSGYLPRISAEDYAGWKKSRHATPENIEHAAKQLLGRPYLWGANSPKGLDCSGLNKFVFFLNGIDLDRNASHQARQGVEVPLDADLSQLRKGDLVFFGFRGSWRRPERVTHTGIYLGDKLFIHSSERVHISSLDPASPIRDAQRIRMLLHARRILPEK